MVSNVQKMTVSYTNFEEKKSLHPLGRFAPSLCPRSQILAAPLLLE